MAVVRRLGRGGGLAGGRRHRLLGGVLLGPQVLVFEHLQPYRRERGLSWSRRTNRKRAYWLRGKVLTHVRLLAACHGILVVERNPAWTIQACPRCGHRGQRSSPDGRGYPCRFRCGHCGWTGDAHVVAALNLKLGFPLSHSGGEASR